MIFPLRTSRWTRFLTSTTGPFEAEVADGTVGVRMGWVGHAEIPVERIARITSRRWPWWGGLGVRIAKGMVAFVPAPGDGVLLEFDGPVTVHAPMSWETDRVLVMAADPERFAAKVAAEREAALPPTP